MPEKTKVNLLPKADLQGNNTGKLLDWITSIGRWIVVLTEFIVICAFLSRFYFDTKLANLFDSLRQKKVIVSSMADFESEFLLVQEKTDLLKTILAEEQKPSSFVNQISQIIPMDVTLTSIQLDEKTLRLSGYSLSTQGINLLISGLKKQPNFSKINLGTISQKEFTEGINFEISVILKNE
jgi:hypothetical protein